MRRARRTIIAIALAAANLAPGAPATAAEPSSLDEIYAALRVESVRPIATTFSRGARLAFRFDLVNGGATALVVPPAAFGSDYPVGGFDHWIERLGADPAIPLRPAPPCDRREGLRLHLQRAIPNARTLLGSDTWAPGRRVTVTLTADASCSTGSWPLGRYRFTVEHVALQADPSAPPRVLGTGSAAFELVGTPPPARPRISATHVVWTDANRWGTATALVSRARADGTGARTLVPATPGAAAASVTLDPTRWQATWAQTAPTASIRRVNVDGSREGLVRETGGQPAGVAATWSGLGWTDAAAGRVRWVQAGQSPETVEDLAAVAGAGDLVHDEAAGITNPARGSFYAVDTAAGAIRLVDPSGRRTHDLVTGLDAPAGIALDTVRWRIYWTERSTIRRAFVDGSGVETVLTGLDQPHGIDVDPHAGLLYWAETGSAPGTGRIRRANLDGTAVRDLVTNLPSPWGLALVIPDATSGSAAYVGGTRIGWTSQALPLRTRPVNVDGGYATTVVRGGPGFVAVGLDRGGADQPGSAAVPAAPAAWTSAGGGRSWVAHTVPAADLPGSSGTPRGFVAAASRGGTIVAAAASGFWRSSDGAAWSPQSAGPTVRPGDTLLVEAGPGGFVALVQRFDTARVQAWTSADGASWRRAPHGTALDRFCPRALAGTATRVVAVGSDCVTSQVRVLVSTNGVTWRRAARQAAFSGADADRVGALVMAGGRFRLFGRSASASGPVTAVWASTDGLTWRRTSAVRPRAGTEPDEIAGVARLGRGWIAIGRAVTGTADCATVAWKSTDLVTWSRVAIVRPPSWAALGCAQPLDVATGGGGRVAAVGGSYGIDGPMPVAWSAEVMP